MAKQLTTVEYDANYNYGSRNPVITSETIHPDGKPWPKCCRGSSDPDFSDHATADGTYLMKETDNSCQCACRRPPKSKIARIIRFLYDGSKLSKLIPEKGRFFCIHRKTEDGFYRECAGWAAKYSGNRP